MQKLFLALMATLLITSCSEKIKAEGEVTTEKVNVSASAAAIRIESAMELILSDQIAEGEIEITTSENIHNYINVVVSNNKISIQLDNNNYKNINIKILASSKQFNSIKASGASTATVKGAELSFESYNISLSGKSSVNVETTLTTKDCNISASGSSSVESTLFTTDNLVVDLSGSSSVKMGVNSSIEGKLSGKSVVNYWGEAATVDVDGSGGSKIHKIK